MYGTNGTPISNSKLSTTNFLHEYPDSVTNFFYNQSNASLLKTLLRIRDLMLRARIRLRSTPTGSDTRFGILKELDYLKVRKDMLITELRYRKLEHYANLIPFYEPKEATKSTTSSSASLQGKAD